MAELRISLLGGLNLVFGGRSLPPPSPPKLVSLLGCLLLNHEQPVTRDQLAVWLWPDVESADARANLRRHLHLLREALPEGEWILTDRDTVQWNPAAKYWLDVDEFTCRVARCTSDGTLQSCEACLALYQGDLLPEVYDDWLILDRERLSQLYLQTLKAAIECFGERGDYATALRFSQQLLRYDPLHEETHRAAMRLNYLAGDRPAALRQFEQCRELLHRELNVEPMPITLELHRAILEEQLPPGRAAPFSRARQIIPAVRLVSVPARPARRRWWVMSAAGVIVLLLLLAFIWFVRRPLAVDNLIISGPADAADTWISEQFPNDLYWPDDPDHTPHSQYSRAHLQYFDHPVDRILIRFDLGALPKDAEIERAIFEIRLETWIELDGAGSLIMAYPAQVSAYQIFQPWQADQATYTRPWSQPGLQRGIDIGDQPLDTLEINGTNWLAFDVTEAVKSWQREPASNSGLMLVISGASEEIAHYWVDLTDQPAPNFRPVLRISYR